MRVPAAAHRTVYCVQSIEHTRVGADRPEVTGVRAGRKSEHRWPCHVGAEAILRNGMTSEHILRDKLRKIEALFAGATTPGEKAAAGAAAERIRDRLGKTASAEKSVELKFS